MRQLQDVLPIEDDALIGDRESAALWEVRGGRRHFTHSKVMAWVALDRAIRTAESPQRRRTGC